MVFNPLTIPLVKTNPSAPDDMFSDTIPRVFEDPASISLSALFTEILLPCEPDM